MTHRHSNVMNKEQALCSNLQADEVFQCGVQFWDEGERTQILLFFKILLVKHLLAYWVAIFKEHHKKINTIITK